MRSKSVVALELKSKSTSKLNNAKKSRQPNWEYQEVMALIQAKRKEYLVGLDMVDMRDQFENVTSCKWSKIAISMNAIGICCCQKILLFTKTNGRQSMKTSSAFFITLLQWEITHGTGI